MVKMMAIEYNMWMSIMELIKNTINNSPLRHSNLNDIDIPILPSYPRDLTKFTKPSIIVQKAGTDNAPVGFGGYLGQYHDNGNNSDLDVFGINYESTYQIDVCGDNNIQRSIMSAILVDELFNDTRFNNNNQMSVYNYAVSLDDPQFMGYARFSQSIDIENLDKMYKSYNEYKLYNNDYITAIRFDISMLQVIIPDNQKLVDLSKPIKINQRIKL